MNKTKTLGEMSKEELCVLCHPERLPPELRCRDCHLNVESEWEALEELFIKSQVNTNLNVLRLLRCPKCGWAHPDDEMSDVVFHYTNDVHCTCITFHCKRCNERQEVDYPYEPNLQ